MIISPEEYIKLYQTDPSLAIKWIEENKDILDFFVSTFTLNHLMAIAWEFDKIDPFQPDSLLFQTLSDSEKNEMAARRRLLIRPITTLVSYAPTHFAALIKTLKDLKYLSRHSASIAEHLIEQAPDSIAGLFKNIEQFSTMSVKVAEHLAMLVPAHIAELFENMEQFTTMNAVIKNCLISHASIQIARLCKNINQFKQLDSDSATNLVSKVPAQIASLLTTSDELLNLKPIILQQLLAEHASAPIANLFISANELFLCAESHPVLLERLIERQAVTIVQLFNTSEHIIKFYNVNQRLARTLFSNLSAETIIDICKEPDAVLRLAEHCFLWFPTLLHTAIKQTTMKKETKDIHLILLESWSKYPVEKQINCLLACLVMVQCLLKKEGVVDTKLEVFFSALLTGLKGLQPEYKKVSNLSIHGQYIKGELEEILADILYQARPQHITFMATFTTQLVEHGQNLYIATNLAKDFVEKFIAAIAENTNLKSCNLVTCHHSLNELLKLVIKRNGELQASQIINDKICTHFNNQINTKIKAIKAAGVVNNAAALTALSLPKEQVYSLCEQAAFFAKNSKSMSQKLDSFFQDTLPTELAELVIGAKEPVFD